MFPRGHNSAFSGSNTNLDTITVDNGYFLIVLTCIGLTMFLSADIGIPVSSGGYKFIELLS